MHSEDHILCHKQCAGAWIECPDPYQSHAWPSLGDRLPCLRDGPPLGKLKIQGALASTSFRLFSIPSQLFSVKHVAHVLDTDISDYFRFVSAQCPLHFRFASASSEHFRLISIISAAVCDTNMSISCLPHVRFASASSPHLSLISDISPAFCDVETPASFPLDICFIYS